MQDFLEALDITAFDARSMFMLLDRDRSGAITVDEFVEGCLRLKGEAKSFDIYCLMYESQRHITKTTTIMERMEEQVTELKDSMREQKQSLMQMMASVTDQVAKKSRQLSRLEFAGSGDVHVV